MKTRPVFKRAKDKAMGSCWKSHVFEPWLENMTFSVWPHDFTQCVSWLSESPCHALFRRGLVFTVATTTKKSPHWIFFSHKNGPTWWFSTSETAVCYSHIIADSGTNPLFIETSSISANCHMTTKLHQRMTSNISFQEKELSCLYCQGWFYEK